MAKVEIKMPEDFLLALSRLGDKTDEIIGKALEAGGETVLANVRGGLAGVIGRGKKSKRKPTGELQGALGLSKPLPKRDGSGWDVKVGFREPRRGKGKSKAKIAAILEYGKHGQQPRPFMRPARTKSRKAAIEAMKAKFEQEVKGV